MCMCMCVYVHCICVFVCACCLWECVLEREPYCLSVSSELNRCVNRDSRAKPHQIRPNNKKIKLSLSLTHSLAQTHTCSHRQKVPQGKQTDISRAMCLNHTSNLLSCSTGKLAPALQLSCKCIQILCVTKAYWHTLWRKYSDDAYHHMPHKP